MNKIDELLAKLTKKKKKRRYITDTSIERGDIITDPIDIERIKEDCNNSINSTICVQTQTTKTHFKNKNRTSLVVQWLRIRLPMQGHGFEPWSGKIPHAMEQLSPCATTTEPAL